MLSAIILFICLLILCVIDDTPDLPIRTTKLSALDKYYQTIDYKRRKDSTNDNIRHIKNGFGK